MRGRIMGVSKLNRGVAAEELLHIRFAYSIIHRIHFAYPSIMFHIHFASPIISVFFSSRHTVTFRKSKNRNFLAMVDCFPARAPVGFPMVY